MTELSPAAKAILAAIAPSMTDTCPYVVSTDEGTSYCSLAEQTASVAKLEDRLETIEHKLNTLRGDHLRLANAVAKQLLPSDRTKFFVDTMKDESVEHELIKRLLALADQAVNEALILEFEDPEDRYIWRELQELKQLAEEGRDD